MYAYHKGKIVPEEEICISPFDLGILRGYGVFDVMRTEGGKLFLPSRHFQRLERSAALLGLALPLDFTTFEKILQELLEKNGLGKDYNIRTVLTGGQSSDAFTPETGQENFFILLTPFKRLPEEYYTEGAKLITLDYQRELATAKVTNYVRAMREQKKKKEAGALEILFVHDGMVTEASTSNVLIVKDRVIITPKEGILMGTTRNLVLELAQKESIVVEERAIALQELLEADEVMITAVNKYIVPIRAVDDHQIGETVPGPVTKKLMKAMNTFVEDWKQRALPE